MKKMQVIIHGINDASHFVAQAAKVSGDVIVKKGRFAVDGKSIMGVMSINIHDGVVVEYPEGATEFEEFLKQFQY